MEGNFGMGTNSKKSGAKKKNSSRKGSKAQPPSQPELEEAAPPRLESTLPNKKRKSDEKQIPLEEKTISSIDQAVIETEKKIMSRSLENPTSNEAWERQLRPRKLPKTFQDVRVGEADASRMIGRRLRVFWPLDDKWYSGLVKSFDVKKKRHHVVYDDGDEEWLELKKERVKILVASGESFGDKPKENECEDGDKPKQKESSSSSSGDGKKSGGKRKRQSVVDIGKKNDGRRKKEVPVKEVKQESAQKNKHEEEEEETRDGETVEGNASTDKVVDSEQVGSAEAHSERNEGLENKEEVNMNKDRCENEKEVEGRISKKVKSSRRTAPRTKRGASAKRTQAKPIAEHDIEDVHVKQHRVGHSEDNADIKLEEGSKAAGNTYSEDVIVPEVEFDPKDDDDDEKKQQKADSSVAETDMVGDVDAKGSMKDATKQVEKLDESTTVPEQLEEQQKDDLVKQGNEDESTRGTADQLSEKHLDVTAGDEKATEKQGDVKDVDQLSKKPNKKQRGKVKPRQ